MVCVEGTITRPGDGLTVMVAVFILLTHPWLKPTSVNMVVEIGTTTIELDVAGPLVFPLQV